LDLARFQSALFAGGKGILKPETFEKMFTPQFAKPDAMFAYGLGFRLGDLDNHKQLGHGGAVYRFSPHFSVFPNDKLGVVVVCSRDVANAVMNRIGDEALKLMLAAKSGKAMPEVLKTSRMDKAKALSLAGRYRCGKIDEFELSESAGRLWYYSGR